MGNPVTIDPPVFSSAPDWDQVHHERDLHIEMFRFTYKREDPIKSVNVLHISTDLESARGTMDRLVSLMSEMGFNSQYEDGLDVAKALDGTDVTIVGCDKSHHDDVRYFIQERIARGFLQIEPESDVLWYGTDYFPQPPSGMDILCSEQNFSVESVCMIHAHSRRRDNIEMWRGSCVSMMIRIENIIDEILNTWNKDTWTKIHRFENKVREDGRWGPDADLFFAALAVIHDARNMAAHSNDHTPSTKQQKKKIISKHLTDNFNSLADMHKRCYLKFKHDTSAPNIDYRRLKWMKGLAQIAVVWITKYRQICAQHS